MPTPPSEGLEHRGGRFAQPGRPGAHTGRRSWSVGLGGAEEVEGALGEPVDRLGAGNYEFACLIVISDEDWWRRFGHLVEANWEASRVRRYSSRDTDGLAALAADPRWSNEGLFAFLEGLRRLAQLHRGDRVAAPTIDVEV